MRVTQIEAENVKGKSFKHTLGGAVAIIGPNFRGKTARPTAIRLALLGYLPELGMLTRATWKLSSGATMSVKASLDGTSIAREWRLDVDGDTVKMNTTGKEIGEVALLHPQAYFEMSPKERMDYIFGAVSIPDAFSVNSIIAECERITFEEAHTENHETAKADEIGKMRESGDHPQATVQLWLGIQLKRLAEAFTYWNRRQRETQGAVTTLAELKLKESQLPTRNLASVDDEIGGLNRSIEEKDKEIGAAEADRKQAESVKGQRASMKKALETDRIDHGKVIEGLQRQKAEAEGGIQDYDHTLHAETGGRLEGLMTERPDTLSAFSAATRKFNEAEAGLEALKKATECPHCKSKGKDWKKNLTQDLQTKLKAARIERDEAGDLLSSLDQTIKALQIAIKHYSDIYDANDTLRDQIVIIDREIAQAMQRQGGEATLREEYSDRLAKLTDVEALNDDDFGKLISERARMVEKRDELEGTKKAVTQLQQDLKRAAQSELEHKQAAAHLEVVKAIQKVLNEKRSEMVTVVFDNLLLKANGIFGNILPTPLAFHEGTVGRWADSGFIDHAVFSGTEKELAYIAIAAALSSQSPVKVVILDEFDRLDAERKKQVIAALHDAMANSVIEQFIVVGTQPLPDLPPEYLMEVIHVK